MKSRDTDSEKEKRSLTNHTLIDASARTCASACTFADSPVSTRRVNRVAMATDTDAPTKPKFTPPESRPSRVAAAATR